MRVGLKKILAPEFDVIDCENGAAAWRMLQSDPSIQVVFSDLSMPEMDGTELLTAIRSSDDDRLKGLPVIIVTGKEDDETTKNEMLALGANDFVTKPFNAVHIKARARSYMSHRQVAQKLNRTEDKLATEATTDPLTGLGSARYLETVATKLIAQIKRHGGEWTWIRLDVDDYKNIYLKHGKAASMGVLQKMGTMIGNSVREGDHAATLGAGRFVLILHSTDVSGASVLAERLCSSVKNTQFMINDEGLRLTASVGVCTPVISETTTFKDIADQVQQSVQAAQQAGGNCVKCIAPPKAEAAPAKTLSLSAAFELLKQGRNETLIENRQALVQQLLPLLSVIAVGAKAELDALVQAVQANR
jgi:diguanylate cyclase (GGDEF)-like protein